MGGFFGVAGKLDCIGDLFYGTDYHSHLGTKYGGMAVLDASGELKMRSHGISNAQFRTRFDSEIDALSGETGIGCIQASLEGNTHVPHTTSFESLLPS